MKVKRFLAALTAAAMALSMTVLPASAEEAATEIQLTGDKFYNTTQDGDVWRNSDMTNLPKPMSVIFNVAEEGYYKFEYEASDGSLTYISPYDVTLNGNSEFEKESKTTTSGFYCLFDRGTVYLEKGLNELTYTITEKRSEGSYLMYLKYAKFTKLSDSTYTCTKNGVSDFKLTADSSDSSIGFITNGNGTTVSGKIYAPRNGMYAVDYIGSIYNGLYTAPYSIYLDDKKIPDATAGSWYDEFKQMKSFQTHVYMDAGEHNFSFKLAGDKVFYLKDMIVSEENYKIDLNYADSAFSGGLVNDGAQYRYISGNAPGTATVKVSASTAGWYKMSYEATAGDGSNVWLSKYLITLNGNNVAVPAPGTSTDNSMNKHEVAESVWLNEGNNTLVFNVNQKRANGTYYFTIRSVTFTFVDKTNKINLPYSRFIGIGGTGEIEGYMLAYNNDATPRTMTATFNAEEAGVYSLRLVSTTGAPGADGKKAWHSDFEVKVNGVSINNFKKTANVLKLDGAVAEQLVGNAAQNVVLQQGANTIEITPTAPSAENAYVLYLKDALFTKTADLPATEISNVSVDSTNNTVSVTYTNPNATGVLLVARYDNDERMTEVRTVNNARAVVPKVETIHLTSTEGKIMVMLWDNYENINSLTEAVIYPTE